MAFTEEGKEESLSLIKVPFFPPSSSSSFYLFLIVLKLSFSPEFCLNTSRCRCDTKQKAFTGWMSNFRNLPNFLHLDLLLSLISLSIQSQELKLHCVHFSLITFTPAHV